MTVELLVLGFHQLQPGSGYVRAVPHASLIFNLSFTGFPVRIQDVVVKSITPFLTQLITLRSKPQSYNMI